MSVDMNCNICNGSSGKLFPLLLLQKHNVAYYQCKECGFMQTEKPYWLSEAYASAITELDIGMLRRNEIFSAETERLLNKGYFDPNERFIDYGGGYGVFVRLMRDKGFDFYRQDIYCSNLFAKYFDISDIKEPGRFELLTSFEVFEHVEDPVMELEKMLEFSDSILFSTELLPRHGSVDAAWWYLTPETGQHISFYSMRSLEILADKYRLTVYSNGLNLHLFTKKKFATHPLTVTALPGWKQKLLSAFKKVISVEKRESLLQKDFDYIRHLIHSRKK